MTISNKSIICKLVVRPSREEPSAYSPTSVFVNSPADVFEKRVEQGSVGETSALSRSPSSTSYRLAPMQSEQPQHTTRPCQWCLHSFENPPVGVPFRINSSGTYDSFGVFCSLECASAFNFDKLHASHVAFARHTMCCELATKHSKQTVRPIKIRPAPPREMLEMFGGPLTIDQFRDKESAYSIVYPLPITAKNQYSEGLSMNSFDSSGPKFVPIEDETIDNLTLGLRRPPVSKKGYRSTLEYMCVPAP